mgnify:CR=1 FL=1
MATVKQCFLDLRRIVRDTDPSTVPEDEIEERFDAIKSVMQDCRDFYVYDRRQIERQWDRIEHGHSDPVPEWYGDTYRTALAIKNALAVRAGWCKPKSFSRERYQRIVDSVDAPTCS